MNTENVNQKDITDVWKSIFKPKHKIVDKNKHRQLQVNFLPAIGYSIQTGFAFNISSEMAFKVSRLPEQKVSSIYTNFTYSQYNQMFFPVQANIWSKNNKLNFITDFRYLKYPTAIHGLEESVDPDKAFNLSFSAVKFHQTVQKEIAKNFSVGVGIYYDNFWNIKYTDSLQKDIAEKFTTTLGNSQRAVGFVIKATYDSRLNQINARQGFYATAVFRPNYTFLGSDDDFSNVQLEARYFLPFPKKTKNVLAFWSYNMLNLSQKIASYFIQPSTGWDDTYNTGRGYIQSRFRGKNMYYLETEYRIHLMKNDLIAAVIFCNGQQFSGNLSSNYERIKIGSGAGLRIKLNKYSDANICIDYGFGTDGTNGIFVNIGEVF